MCLLKRNLMYTFKIFKKMCCEDEASKNGSNEMIMILGKIFVKRAIVHDIRFRKPLKVC